MTDVLGPANALNAVTAKPTDTRVFGADDTYFKDCTSSVLNDGTRLMASFLNGALGQLRHIIRGNGNTGNGDAVVAANNTDDDMMLKAIQHLIQRGLTNYVVAAGTSNALAVTPAPVVAEYKAGLSLRIKIASSNTAAATLNVNGLGARPIVRPDGAALAPADLRADAVAEVIYDGTRFQVVAAKPGVLTANVAYYVNGATGSDANTGLDVAHPFATIQVAIDKANSYDLNGYSVTIYVADYLGYGAANLRRFTGTGSITIIGNTVTPSNVLLTANGAAIGCDYPGYAVKGVKVSSPSPTSGLPGIGIFVPTGGVLDVSDIEYGACAAYQIAVDGGSLTLNGTQRVSGNSTHHILSQNNGQVRYNQLVLPTLIIANPVTFSTAFIGAYDLGVTAAIYSSITNLGYVTGKRYAANANGVIHTGGGGPNYYPGTIAGDTATGGQYV